MNTEGWGVRGRLNGDKTKRTVNVQVSDTERNIGFHKIRGNELLWCIHKSWQTAHNIFQQYIIVQKHAAFHSYRFGDTHSWRCDK